jgi:hypothetical protein
MIQLVPRVQGSAGFCRVTCISSRHEQALPAENSHVLFLGWKLVLCCCLRAESLEIAFTHPSTQQRLQIKLPEPQRFGVMRQQLHNRWSKVSQLAAAADASTGSEADEQEAAAAPAAGSVNS